MNRCKVSGSFLVTNGVAGNTKEAIRDCLDCGTSYYKGNPVTVKRTIAQDGSSRFYVSDAKLPEMCGSSFMVIKT